MPLRKLLNASKLYMQKLDTMLLNDIRLFLRDRKSLILVVLTPFLILSILINIFYFSDVAENIRGVKLAVCDRDGRGFDLESEIFKTTMFTGDCEAEVAELVSSGEFRGAVVIPKGFRTDILEGRGTQLVLFIDNSKQTTAVVTSNAVKAYVSDLNEEIGTAFINEAWKQLKELNENLRFLVANLEKATPVARELQGRLEEVRVELEGIDFESQQQAVDDVVGFLNLLELELDYVDSKLPKAGASIPVLPNVGYTPNVTAYKKEVELYRVLYCGNASVDPVCPLLDYTDSYVLGLTANITAATAELNDRIAEVNSRNAEVEESLERLLAVVAANSEKGSQLRKDIEAVRANLEFMEEKSENITQTIAELDASLDKFLSDIIRVTDELKMTIEVLDGYTQKDPASILRPVSVDARPVFKDKLEIFYRLPALMSILLLFITLFVSSSLIVNERRGGTMARIFLSPISMFFYVAEKMLYLLLLAALAVLSMIGATYLFGVGVELSLELFIVFLVAALVYIAIGVFVGAMSKSENTSLLTCLVIGFPLMFLSGAFNPPELMDQYMRVLSQYLPLSLNVNLIEKLTIYHTGIDVSQILVLVGVFVVFYLLSVLMIRKKPTLK
ncbi:ABC transporter permease [Candidatus Woesearchaeota archaeon]|nr:ABC transporter permease [Candidatus Woesearchaeota archaeon]